MIKVKLSKIDIDFFRSNLLTYTRKAFEMLPEMKNPYILDIGCGSGIPTMELAKLSDGRVLGLDIDKIELDKLEQKIRKEGLSERVQIIDCSMFKMDFKDESFDIIWAEGSISAIGFKKGLHEFRRFIKPNGFLVIHDELKNLEEKLAEIPNCGYKLIGHFILSKDVWLKEYYLPLKKHLEDQLAKHPSEYGYFQELDKLQKELDDFKKHPESYQSGFFVMQKI